jgi:hypothetical protein
MNHACFNRTHFNMSRHARPGIIKRLARAFGRLRAMIARRGNGS